LSESCSTEVSLDEQLEKAIETGPSQQGNYGGTLTQSSSDSPDHQAQLSRSTIPKPFLNKERECQTKEFD
jgi:hypothetical protein